MHRDEPGKCRATLALLPDLRPLNITTKTIHINTFAKKLHVKKVVIIMGVPGCARHPQETAQDLKIIKEGGCIRC